MACRQAKTAIDRGTVAVLLSFVRLGEFHDKGGTQFEWDVTLQPLGDKKKPCTGVPARR